jgi:hypothetical protein
MSKYNGLGAKPGSLGYNPAVEKIGLFQLNFH